MRQRQTGTRWREHAAARLATTRTPDVMVAPLAPGAPVIDCASAVGTAFAVSPALFQRERPARRQGVGRRSLPRRFDAVPDVGRPLTAPVASFGSDPGGAAGSCLGLAPFPCPCDPGERLDREGKSLERRARGVP